MMITCNHPASSYGVPVILDDDGDVMDYGPGLTAVLGRIGWTRYQSAREAGYKSGRSIEKYWQGHPPSARYLNVLQLQLEDLDT